MKNKVQKLEAANTILGEAMDRISRFMSKPGVQADAVCGYVEATIDEVKRRLDEMAVNI